ncbi:3-phosphoshikimate 1-carboxyvinyltransferase [Seminavis robusta]|uniref:3-phosphoshikimate 1-carboxyvinyltransferase n=1 Tax=Seminavis robusta TaxID=568900 RepID=A0A9N8DKZ7_9STRA|nr:3-phosphoshikimate 1-carboxyvinyltransferase [Seminavis robusta]|eukprot:Sro142_g066260.1 3-phosphoshikimate 1-carboxyvinyltransferase (490) ;mRNA; r:61644-63235
MFTKVSNSMLLASLLLLLPGSLGFLPTTIHHHHVMNKALKATVPAVDEATNSLTVTPIKSLDGTVTLPGSKSLSNRCLLLAALSEGSTKVDNLLDSDDIRYMLEALDQMKVPVEKHSESSVTVTGQAGPINSPLKEEEVCELFLGNAGTAMRPLAAALCMGEGKFVLDGVPRMRERPIADLVDGLKQLGADVSCVEETGCPPVTINANGLKGGKCSISGKMSSQFLSSLLMAAPVVDGDVTISIKDELISAPYVALTIGLMKKFGVNVEIEGDMDGTPSFHIAASEKYISPKSILVEGDASSASYFIAGAAITGGTVEVRGCGSDSVQGDVAFADVMEQMGAKVTWAPESITVTRDPSVRLKGVDVDCGKIPDAAMTLAVAALFADGPTTIRNVYSWRLKETERMKAIVAECTKLGATVEEFEDYCIIHPPKDNKINDNVLIETYDDHRMAMTFSLAACGGVDVRIHDPGCTAKTFPTYFEMLESITER